MPDTITVAGVVMLTDSDGLSGHSTGGLCSGDGGYDDLALGASVTVYDGSSAIIGGGIQVAHACKDGLMTAEECAGIDPDAIISAASPSSG